MAQIECTNALLGYEGQPVLKDLTFRVSKGDYLCVIGENGAGKSTLIKTLLGLTPPLGGTIRLGDGLKQADIGYLPQQTDIQRDFPASVREIVLSGCANRLGRRPFYRKEEKRRALRSMEDLSILPLADRCYRELSGGQQQRVLLARALCATSALLVMDEPAAGLDPVASQELYQLISEINRKGVTIIIVSHDLPSTLRYASHILHIGGPSAYYAAKEEYIASEYGAKFIRMAGGEK
ncbi:MAG: ABC transporter ATP-binding protein [Clostridia bacterium]|nr:ABC transporter ATP-binding protein [Clostridia bacterium]